MLSWTVRPSRTAATIEAKLSSASTIALAAFAASVPRPPIATPMSARLSAGASFTPSPVIATTSLSACSASTSRSLSSGLVRAKTVASRLRAAKPAASASARSCPVTATGFGPSPSRSAIALAVAAWSPVTIFTAIPAARHSATAVRASARGGSISPTSPISVSPRSTSSGASAPASDGNSRRASASTRWPSLASAWTCRSQQPRSSGVGPSPVATAAHISSTRSGAPLTKATAGRPARACRLAI